MEKFKPFPLPLFKSPTGGRFKFPAYFNGSHIIVEDSIAILNLHTNGHFGVKVPGRFRYSKIDADSQKDDDNTDDEMGEIKEEEEPLHQKEHLFLLHEEAIFLLHLNCLQLTDQNQSELDMNKAWKLFNELNNLFLQNYIVYHYYRSRKWVVKSGLKFGGDFLLYKESPESYHSIYIVLIDVAEDVLQHEKFKTRRSMGVSKLLGANRLAETAGKQILIAKISAVQVPIDIDVCNSIDCMKLFEIRELFIKRQHNKMAR